MERAGSDEIQQLQLSGTETLFPTSNNPSLFRTDVTPAELPYVEEADAVSVAEALGNVMATECFLPPTVMKSRRDQIAE